MVYVWITLAAVALAIMVGLIWMIFLNDASGDRKEMLSDLNAAIRQDVETKFDNSPQLADISPVEENSVAEMVVITPPAKPVQLASIASVPAAPAASHVAPKKTFDALLPAELDSSRVEITIVNGEGRILRLASRSYQKLVSGREIVFGVSEIGGVDANGVVAGGSCESVDPIAMKILSMSRWGGAWREAADSGCPAGLVYAWCEFYGNDGLKLGASKGVLDKNSLSLKPGGVAAYRMFFKPAMSHSSFVPDDVIFQSRSSRGNLAMAAGRESAFVGMPVFFK